MGLEAVLHSRLDSLHQFFIIRFVLHDQFPLPLRVFEHHLGVDLVDSPRDVYGLLVLRVETSLRRLRRQRPRRGGPAILK